MKENLDLPNPFEYGTFVTGEQFCGRSKEITELRKAILGHQHLLINAERRIGKTSLVEQILLQLGTLGGTPVRGDGPVRILP